MVAGQGAGDQVAAVGAHCVVQGFQVGRRQLVEENRQRGFGQDGQLCRVPLDQFQIEIERADEGFRTKLHFLRDVALNQRHADRLADGLRPEDLAQPEAAGGEQSDDDQTAAPACQRGTGQRDQQRQAMHAEQRREAGQGLGGACE